MNAQYLVLILVKYWIFNELITRSVAHTQVTYTQVKSNPVKIRKTHTRRLHANARSYLYLNYKEAYGLRFDPKKIHKKRQSNSSNDDQSMGGDVSDVILTPPLEMPITTMASDYMQTISSSTEIVSNITIASPSSSDVSITTTSSKVSSTEGTRPSKQPVLAFSSLLNWNSATKRQNATTMIQQSKPPSSLKETLLLIRKRLKQWLALGTDTKSSLVNGQRFLNVFNVIKFENGPCTSTQEGLTEMSGICYQDFQCTEMGGSSIDECADGLGVCCVCKRIFIFMVFFYSVWAIELFP